MRQKVKIVGIQMEPTLMEKEKNLSSCLEKIRETARVGAGLIVFPECNLSGYCFSSLKEAIPLAETIPGPCIDQIASLCRDLNVYRENRIFYVAVNRVGEERGFRFFGCSKITDCRGVVLADGKPYEEDILYADIEPAMAREKHVIVRPGELEYHIFNDRRPEFYGPIVNPLEDTSRIR